MIALGLVILAFILGADGDLACQCLEAGGVYYSSPDMAGGPSAANPQDGIVDVQDFLKLLAAWGDCPLGQCCRGDINRDGVVGVTDFTLLLEAWGSGPLDFERCRELPP